MIPDEETVFLSRLAISGRVATKEQIETCLKHREQKGSRQSLADLLFELGFITGEKYKTLMSLASGQRPVTPAEQKGPRLFGKIVLERGLATPEQVREALKIQGERAEAGKHQNLGEILIERGYLTETQVRSVLAEEEQIIMVCVACTQNYNVLRTARRNARCPQCGEDLVEAEPDQGLGVIATIRGEEEPDSPVGNDYGGCRILELIGRGAMGHVYRARQIGLDRLAAVKLISMQGRSPEIVKRLLAEARAVAQLEHANIVQVYEAGFQRGYFYLVMQLLNGETLSRQIEETGILPLDEAVRIASDVARGLGYAHRKGIIHRDVKPANILLTLDGRVRITDFGLALNLQQKETEDAEMVVGTPYYMPPEQWLGKKADERSDLYSLGVMLYQMLAGRRPFESENMEEVMKQHLKMVVPPVHQVNADVPVELSAIVRKLMAKVPEQRYRTAEDFLEDLARWRRGESPLAMAQVRKQVRCGFCEAINPVGQERCSVCREPLQRKTNLAILPREDEYVCPKCREITSRKSRTCERCGTGICIKCRKQVAVDRGYCRPCAPPPPSPNRR